MQDRISLEALNESCGLCVTFAPGVLCFDSTRWLEESNFVRANQDRLAMLAP